MNGFESGTPRCWFPGKPFCISAMGRDILFHEFTIVCSSFVTGFDNDSHLCHESIARRNDVSESGTEESCVPNILWIGSSIQLVWNR